FGPSKFGSIPEILRPDRISAGNGIVGLTTVVAVVGGTVLGNYLFDWTQPDGRSHLWISALALLAVAGAGFVSSLGVFTPSAADPGRPFPINLARQTVRDFGILARSKPMLRVALGVAFFWTLASLAQLNVDVFGIQELELSQRDIGPLLGMMSLGVALGN